MYEVLVYYILYRKLKTTMDLLTWLIFIKTRKNNNFYFYL